MIAVGTKAEDSPVDHPMLEFRAVGRCFQTPEKSRFVALSNVDLTVRRGEFVCLVGPSGCGKSTLLELAAGLLKQSSGSIVFDGAELDGINVEVGYVTQRDSLLPWRTVRRNVGLPLEVQGWSRSARREKVDELLRLVGLTEFANHYPSQLSGGMLKRTSIAQTLSYGPSTLLMDEPFGALDAQLRRTLQDELLEIWSAERCTVLFVTHDIDEAVALADRIVVFAANPGRIIRIEDVSLPRPRTIHELTVSEEGIALRDRLWTLLGAHGDAEADQGSK